VRQSALPFLAILLLASEAACDAVPRTGTSSQQPTESPASLDPVAQPAGIPKVMGWDGVTGRIVIQLYPSWPTRAAVDYTTYAFSRNQWTKVPTVQSFPDPRPGMEIAMTYDSDRNRAVAVYVPSGRKDVLSPTTWNWDGKEWRGVNTVHQLPSLRQPSAAYSLDLHAVVLIGHCSSSTDRAGDTLLFDGRDWRSVWTPNTPKCPAKLAYSRLRHAIVALSFADKRTWTFDGHDWLATPPVGTALAPTSTSPPIGNQMDTLTPSAGFDVKRDTWVLFGGAQGNRNVAKTWTGDGSGWTLLSPQNSPIARSGSAMAWDPRLDAIVLFGGTARQPGVISQLDLRLDLSDTWSWDGLEWHQLAGPDYHSTPSPLPKG
jgi:hypothetical protein